MRGANPFWIGDSHFSVWWKNKHSATIRKHRRNDVSKKESKKNYL